MNEALPVSASHQCGAAVADGADEDLMQMLEALQIRAGVRARTISSLLNPDASDHQSTLHLALQRP
jgi:hypothetical protein